MKINVKKLDHVAIDVEDVEKAKTFYSDLLGLNEIPRPESFDFPGAWYDLGNIVLHVVGPRKPALGKHHIAFGWRMSTIARKRCGKRVSM